MNALGFGILLSLKDDPRDADGVLQRMRELREDDEPAIASFYRALKRAVEAGHVEVLDAAGETEEGRRGRPPQRYRITRSGKTALAAEARRLGRLAELALSGRESR
jgi:DNA-binding PadR family transcriptional regulator